MKILIVEEEPNIRSVLTCTVEREHTTQAVSSWRAAWAELQKEFYDAVVLDLHLSSGDALEAISHLASGLYCSGVIAYSTVDQRAEALRRGAVDCLIQPFTPDEFRRALAQVRPRARRPVNSC